jgi:hypothetical protein
MYQLAAERAFQKQREYFSDPKRVPYPLQGDIARMSNKRDETKHGQDERLRGFSLHMQQASGSRKSPGPHGKRKAKDDDDGEEEGGAQETDHGAAKVARSSSSTAAYHRQRLALQRQDAHPWDDEETKILRYCIHFTENCNVLEDEVEIYEYMAPTNSITRCSLLYGTVPSPLAHIIIDYRNIRTAQIRQAYADSYNTQAKLICSYNASKTYTRFRKATPSSMWTCGLRSSGWA